MHNRGDRKRAWSTLRRPPDALLAIRRQTSHAPFRLVAFILTKPKKGAPKHYQEPLRTPQFSVASDVRVRSACNSYFFLSAAAGRQRAGATASVPRARLPACGRRKAAAPFASQSASEAAPLPSRGTTRFVPPSKFASGRARAWRSRSRSPDPCDAWTTYLHLIFQQMLGVATGSGSCSRCKMTADSQSEYPFLEP